MAIMIPIVLIGGAVGFLWYSGKLPFIKKKTHAVAVVKTTTAKTADISKETATPSVPVLTAPPPRAAVSAPAVVDPLQEANLTRMANIYNEMPAEDAIKLFTKLPDQLVEKLLRRMDESKVAKLLALLPVDRAVKLTAKMAVK